MINKLLKILICVALAAAVVFGGILLFYTLENRRVVKVQEITVKSEKINAPFRAVQLSDLHGTEIGKDNEKLVAAALSAEPDLILMTGDMFSRDGTGYGETLTLIESLYGVAPVYYSLGNHEDDYFFYHKDEKEEMIGEISDRGAIVLEHEYEDISIAGADIRLGGFFGYATDPDPSYFEKLQEAGCFENWRFDKVWNVGKDDAFLKKIKHTDRFILLMCHVPDSYILFNGFEKYPADLILSGHLHGGQIILPLAGPVFAPNQGIFPEKTEGIFSDGSSQLYLSKGLGSGKPVPRINNSPEITVIDVVPG